MTRIARRSLALALVGLALAAAIFYAFVPRADDRIVRVRLEAEYQSEVYVLGGEVLCTRTHFYWGAYNPDIWVYTPTPLVFAQTLPDGSLLLLRNTAKFCGPKMRPWSPELFEDFLPVVEWYDSAETPERARIFFSARIATDDYAPLSLRGFGVSLEDDGVSRLERRLFLRRYEKTAAQFDRRRVVTHNRKFENWTRHPALFPLRLDPRSIPAVAEIASRPGQPGARFAVIPRCSERDRVPAEFDRRYLARRIEHGIDLMPKPYEPHFVPSDRRTDYEGVVPLHWTGQVWQADPEALGSVEMGPDFLNPHRRSYSAPARIEWAGELLEAHPYELIYDRREDRIYLLEGRWTHWSPSEPRSCAE